MSAPQLLVHDKKDTVGVVVVEGLTAGTDMLVRRHRTTIRPSASRAGWTCRSATRSR